MDSTTETVLRNLEETQHDFWNISRSTANFLNMMIKITQAKNVIEVGTSNGYSGIWLAKALKETGGHLTTIEFYEKRIVLAKENFKTCGVADIIDIKQGSAIEVLEEIQKYFSWQTPIIATEVGQHQVWASRCLQFKSPRKFITSGGLGTMGFGFPASIGACVGANNQYGIDHECDHQQQFHQRRQDRFQQ